MAVLTRTMIALAVLILGIAVLLKEDHIPPEEFSNPWKLAIHLSLTKTIVSIAEWSEVFGYNPAEVIDSICAWASRISPPQLDPSVKVSNMIFDGVPVRLYNPHVKTDSSVRKGLVYFHGGGFVMGDLNMYEGVTHRIALDTGAVVISVDYRKAPKHVFPAAVNDAETATKYFIKHASEFNVDSNRIAVMGDSAGGNLATVVSRRLRDLQFTPMPKLQVLIYPVIQKISNDVPSYRYNKNGPAVTERLGSIMLSNYIFGYEYHSKRDFMFNNTLSSKAFKRFAAKKYMNIDKLPKDVLLKGYEENLDIGNDKLWEEVKDVFLNPDLHPLFANDLSGLPPVYISTCQYDCLRDEGFFYVSRLREEGVDVTHQNLHICFHGWLLMNREIDTFDRHFREVMEFINKTL